MHCNSCGAENRDDAQFCANCGSNLEAGGAVSCFNCGTAVAPDLFFCPTCGKQLKANQAEPPPPEPGPLPPEVPLYEQNLVIYIKSAWVRELGSLKITRDEIVFTPQANIPRFSGFRLDMNRVASADIKLGATSYLLLSFGVLALLVGLISLVVGFIEFEAYILVTGVAVFLLGMLFCWVAALNVPLIIITVDRAQFKVLINGKNKGDKAYIANLINTRQ